MFFFKTIMTINQLAGLNVFRSVMHIRNLAIFKLDLDTIWSIYL